ncbi:MAG: chemotaxis protein CheA [Nitrospinae bacterium]|nr:chemotaxis protein CheA [Nitrospinota bacterium]
MASNIETILQKLDVLALDCTMMDPSLSDLKTTVELGQKVEELKNLLAGQQPPQLAQLFNGLNMTLDKFLMNETDSAHGPAAIGLLDEAINLSRDALSAQYDEANFKTRVDKFLATMKESFGIAPDMPKAAAPAAPEPKPAEQPAPAPAAEAKGDAPIGSKIVLMDENDAVIFDGFLDESTDMVNKIEEYVMALEENPENMDIINSLFRVFHSLKGAAGFLGMNEINTLCHDAENLLDNARKGKMKVDREFSDIVMVVRDMLEKGLAAIGETLAEGKQNLPNFTGPVKHLNIEQVIQLIDRKLFGGTDEEPAQPKLGEILLERKIVTPDQLKQALDLRDKPLGQILVDMGAAPKEKIGEVLQEQAKAKAPVVAAIKVDTKKLNTLLELVGELVIAQAIISQNKGLQSEQNIKLSKDIGEMAKITGGIQDHIMSLRMVPLRQTFQKMNRLVRDLCRKTNKEVNFVVHGEETEIDKTIVEQLNDPLVHLLRNAVDHGVESAEDRKAQGKSAEGTITLAAYQKGGNVVIEIRDDGKGLNIEKIKSIGVERGLIDKNRTYAEEEIRNLIFLPGFSTHKVATDISGRGVGMDVVRRNVEQLGGRVEIFSVPGKGSTFMVKLPLTMAIVDGMLVQVGSERFIIPTVTISESIQPKPEQLSTVTNKGEMMNVRGELIPLVRLHELFGISGARKDVTQGLVIIVGTEKEKRGLMVDDLLGQQQVVIKNLDKRLQGIRGFSGSSILGDGLVGLILDVGGVFELAAA